MRLLASVLALYVASVSFVWAFGGGVPGGTVAAVPEPETLALFAVGAVAFIANRPKRK